MSARSTVTFEPDVDWALIPEHIRPGLTRYVEEHQEVGGFLTAVLSNDLRGAIGHADPANLDALPDIVRFLYNYVPSSCWGSPGAVKAWLAP